MAIFSNNVSIANDGELIGGGVEWQSVKTASFTAVANEGYFVNTTSGTVTVTLPASPNIGDIVQLKDYARTWGTNNVTIASVLIDGSTNTATFSTSGQTVTLVYMDNTKGWSLVNEDTTTNLGPEFISATGGTITTSTDFKIHTFTGDGCFVVSNAGNPLGSTTVDYLVVAGGGGGASGCRSGGGGAGGYRESSGAASGCYTVSPLGACVSALPVSATTYPVTVGAGGVGGNPSSLPLYPGTNGANSIFSTITSAGGGGGGGFSGPGSAPTDGVGLPGGSGGGGWHANKVGGTGNTPPVSPPQGQNGGNGVANVNAGSGGGGGAGAAGGNGCGCVPGQGGPGGDGVATSITGSPVTRAGGGGGAGDNGVKPGGSGGGGAAGNPGVAGTTNTGGGGGGGAIGGVRQGGAGGKGIVIIRYKFQ